MMSKKLIQSRVADSRLTLPVTFVYAIAVWLACGLVSGGWWLQFGCFVVAYYLVMVLNNQSTLTRAYLRMANSTFLALTCSACFLMPDARGACMLTALAGAYLFLFQSYQDKSGAGLTFYGFLMIGLSSMARPQVLFFVPLVWLLMATKLLSLSWRTWSASLLGLLTPYWFWMGWLAFQQDFGPLVSHLVTLVDFQFPIRYADLGTGVLLVCALLAACMLTGIVHLQRKTSYNSIRVRLLYGFMIWMDLYAAAWMVLQPQHYDTLLRIIILNTAPLTAHFLALTATKATNAAFVVLAVLALAITAFNVWSMSFPS